MTTQARRTPFLLILVGLPSSGKTTLARRIASALEAEGLAAAVLSTDEFRTMVSAGGQFDPGRESFVNEAFQGSVQIAVEKGFFTIVDDMNYYESMRKRLREMALKHRIGFGIVHIDVPPEVAKRWNAERGEPVPNSLIDEIAMRFDRPGKKYAWDRPLVTADPSSAPVDEIARRCVEASLEKLKGLPQSIVKSRPVQATEKREAEVERLTRRALGEIMRRYRAVDLGHELSELRKSVSREALDAGRLPEEAVKRFLSEAETLIQQLPAQGERVLLHVGLFGHVDHGKTSLAARLTEKPSTASLDKHPEAQRRGMTIDMGFSAFRLDGFLVTLVDLPGHYSLVKHAMAGASIIDIAVLVVAADEGPKVQTLEHLSILKGRSVERLVVALNKVDLVPPGRVEEARLQISSLLRGTKFEGAPIVEVSAAKSRGIEELKGAILSVAKSPVRRWVGPLRIPIDHAFHVSGAGTVVTGTIVSGRVARGEEVEVLPLGRRCKVKLIQSFGEGREGASAGDRVGIALSDLKPDELRRGFVLVTPGTMRASRGVEAKVAIDQGFPGELIPRTQVHASLGLVSTTARVTPYQVEDGKKVVLDRIPPGAEALCHIAFHSDVPVEEGDEVILFKFDLPPKSSRILGTGRVLAPLAGGPFYRKRVKTGKVVRKLSADTVVAAGLFASPEAAERYLGHSVLVGGGEGIIKGPSHDGLILQVARGVEEGMSVTLPIYRSVKV